MEDDLVSEERALPLLNWSPQNRIPGAHTTGLPQLVEFQNKVYACWTGIHEPNGYYSVFDGKNWSANQIQIPGVSSSSGPTVTVFNNQLYFFWTKLASTGVRGAHDNSIYYRTFDGGSNWGVINQVPKLSAGDWASVASFQGELFMVFRGASQFQDDANHWMKMSSSGAWSSPAVLAGGASNVGPSLTVFDNKLFAAWQGIGSDQGIYWSTCSDGNIWAGQKNIPNVGTNGVPGLATLPDRLCAAWKGEVNDDGIYCSYFQGNGPWAQPQEKVAGSGSASGPGLAAFNNQVIAAWQGDPNDPTVWWSTVTAG